MEYENNNLYELEKRKKWRDEKKETLVGGVSRRRVSVFFLIGGRTCEGGEFEMRCR